MPLKTAVHVLLLTADPDLAELYRHECPQCVVTVAKDAAALSRKPGKYRFDALIVESRKDWVNEVKAVTDMHGPTPLMTLVGSTPFLTTCTPRNSMTAGIRRVAQGESATLTR